MSDSSITPDATESRHYSELFTVRLWHEPLGQGRSEWRGQVRHVLSGETRYFRDWPMLVACMQEMLGSNPPEGSA